MKRIYSGFIDVQRFNDFDIPFIRFDDGRIINLLTRVDEDIRNYGNKVSIHYYISKDKIDYDSVLVNYLRVLDGDCRVELESDYYCYSEYTEGIDYNTIFDVCGHNLCEELVSKNGMYLNLSIEYKK